MEKKHVLLLILAFVLLLIGGVRLYGELNAAPDLPQSDESEQSQSLPAPDFTVYDMEGNAKKLSELRGKPVVLNFWASSCHYCKKGMPAFAEAHAQLGDEVHFMMVNVTDGFWDTADTATAYISDAGHDLPYYLDTDLSASITYGARSLPVTYFLNADGALVANRSGMMSLDILLGGIDLINH